MDTVQPATISLLDAIQFLDDSWKSVTPVSYTHLDVYKRQHYYTTININTWIYKVPL